MMLDDIIIPLTVTVISSLIIILLIWLFKKYKIKIFFPIYKRLPYRIQLSNYREQLEKETLKIKHPWMKQGQSLDDILIPVNVHLESQTETITNFQGVLSKQFSKFKNRVAPRIIVLGLPGSGKSVALRVAARESWNLSKVRKSNLLVPVLITFSDFKNAKYKMETAIINSLNSRNFKKSRVVEEGDASEFIGNHLYEGDIFILVDALDELDLKDRSKAAKCLKSFLQSHPEIPAIMSCRIAPYNKEFDELNPLQINMAEFSPMAINFFVQNWQFEPPKSGTELWINIRDNPHLRELAKNPLMLTIIAYMYSQPKYRLPENRALFYEVCVRALLEEWDIAMNPERANRFDRPHKEFILSYLAYKHLSGGRPDEDIDYRKTLEQFSFWMDELGLNRGENKKMLDEIIYNSGLLIFLPPDGLRFPHQTFIEFFGALHIHNKCTPVELISKYKTDPQRWREVLLLYLGLTSNIEYSIQVIKYLLENDNIKIVINSLSDCRIIEPNLANSIISRAKNELATTPSQELIKNLGILSSKPRLALSNSVHKLLLERLRTYESLSDSLVQELILSILRLPTKESTSFILNNYERLNLQKIISEMGEKSILIVNRLLNLPEISPEKMQELIDGLRLAGESKILIDLLISTENETIKRLTAIALARLSKTKDFWFNLDTFTLPQIPHNDEIKKIENEWGWPFDKPKTKDGMKLLYLICYYCACSNKEGINQIKIKYEEIGEFHPRIYYLVSALSTKRKKNEIILDPEDIYSEKELLSKISTNKLQYLWLSINKKGFKRTLTTKIYNKELNEVIAGLGLLMLLVSYLIFWGWNLISILSHIFYDSNFGFDWPLNLYFFFILQILIILNVYLFFQEKTLDDYLKVLGFFLLELGGGPLLMLFRFNIKIDKIGTLFICYILIGITLNLLFMSYIIMILSIINILGWLLLISFIIHIKYYKLYKFLQTDIST